MNPFKLTPDQYSLDYIASLVNFDVSNSTVTKYTNRSEYVFSNGTYIYSYGTLVAVQIHDPSIFILGRKSDCSSTTAKHITQFTGITAAERKRMLADGTAFKSTQW